MREPRTALFVAGPDACGVEVVAQALQLLRRPPVVERVARINDGILATWGGSRGAPPVLPAGWEEDPRLRELTARAAELLRTERVLADPCLALTLAFWRRLTAGAACVLCVQDPSISPEAAPLWQHVVTAALSAGRGAPLLVINARDWLDRPDQSLQRVAAFADVRPPGPHELAAMRGLVHRRSSSSEPSPELALPPETAALWAALRHGVDDQEPLWHRLSTSEAALAEARGLARERAQLLGNGLAVMSDISDALDRIGRSRSWRYGHGVLGTLAAIRRRRATTTDAVQQARDRLQAYLSRVHQVGGAPSVVADATDSISIEPVTVDRSELMKLGDLVRRRLGPPPTLREVPSISVVVLNRNGRRHLEHLVEALVHSTEPAPDELVVVDNASTDDSVAYLESFDFPFALRLVRNAHNESFADASNRGARAATGDLLLFLNNDVRPFEPGWLAELIACRARTGATIVGARLIDAARDCRRPEEWSLQHRGVRFTMRDGVPLAVNAGAGDDALDDGHLGEDLDCPAVTAACLLVDAGAFAAVGGFDGRYWYGSEDVDLALSVIAGGGRIICCGRAVLLHHESSTRRADASHAGRIHQLTNRTALLARWGPRLRRDVAIDRLTASRFWDEQAGRVLIADDGDGRRAEDLATGLRGLGLEPVLQPHDDPTSVPADVDAAVTMEPAMAAGCATAVRDALVERERLLGFCIKIGAPDWERAKSWGDLHFATALRRELESRGHRCVIQVAEEWDAPEGMVFDVALQLRGRGSYLPRPGQINVLWSISHPEDLAPAECDGFDLVCVGSDRFAARLAPRTSTPVAVLEQATDPTVFYPDPDPRHRREVVVVANTRGVEREAVRDLLPTDRDVAIWGRGWEKLVPPAVLAGEELSQDEVRHAYSSALVVLNDHWPDMRRHGYVSNRVYDALACGAIVISDDVPELAERFGESVLRYRSRRDLHRLLDHITEHVDEARERSARGRSIVLNAHTFAHRVKRLLELVEERRAELGRPLTVRASTG